MANTEGKAGSKFYSPQIHSRFSVGSMMWDVVIALIPAGAAAVVFFGFSSINIILVSVSTGILTELLMNLITRRKVSIFDGSVFITSLLFAYSLPPGTEWYITAAGCFFAVAVVKWAFGGLGQNFINPALGGRIFVSAVWPGIIFGRWTPPMLDLLLKGTGFKEASQKILNPDAVSSATQLGILKTGGWESLHRLNLDNYWNMLIGNRAGCIGETPALALLAGFIYLSARRTVVTVVPLFFTGTSVLLAWVFGGIPLGTGLFTGNPLFHILSGGFVLGALFMAADPVTTPLSLYGKIISGIMLGILTMAIRLFCGYPEGICYAIVLVNIFVPLVDKVSKERIFGQGKHR